MQTANVSSTMVEEQTLSSTPFVGGAPGYEMGLSVIAPEPWLGMGPGLASLQPEMRVLSILGTRPEAIKLAPVITELRNRPGIVSQVVSTGQHREMLHQALDNDPPRMQRILQRTPMQKFGDPRDIGHAAVYLCSPAARFVTGVVLPIDGGASIGF